MEGFAQSNEFCPNEACPDYGKLQKDQSKPNLKKIGFTRAGVQRYQCKSCNGTFTETRGTIFYRKRTPEHKILETLALLAEGNRISSLTRVKRYKEDREYSGNGRPPTRKQAQPGWQYLQMVKQRDAHGYLEGIYLRAVFGKKSDLIALMGKSTAYVERSHLTARLFNSRLVRKTLAFSKDLSMHRAAATWQDGFYNLIRPHKSLRLPVENDPRLHWQKRTPAMAAGLTDHIWTVKELLTLIPLPFQKLI